MDTKSSGLFPSTEEKRTGNPETNDNEELKGTMTSSNLIAYNNELLGHILTIVDASVPESDQKKAMKSLIKQSVWKTYDVVWKWMNDQRGNGNGSSFPFVGMQSVE
jgi:hypothetical protein